MTKPKLKSKPRQTTLKARLRQPSVRLTAKDKKRLWIASADLASENFRKTYAKVKALQQKLSPLMRELETFADILLTFAVKSDPSCIHDWNGK